MKIPLNTTCYGLDVIINISGETGKITGFCRHMRMKQGQFFVEYKSADGRFCDGWFTEDQIALR